MFIFNKESNELEKTEGYFYLGKYLGNNEKRT